ncbi:MAG TPA: phosphatase PAP2 family protein [Candidatus Pacearchaeota archaeon]|nr:phosphatase PAP2 family protein [Candidatus Pacearchaeota archaeon]
MTHILFRDLSLLGGIVFYAVFSLFFLSLQEINFFWILLINFIVSTILLGTIRFFYHKERPIKESYSTVIEKINASSFPSMHAWRVGMIFMSFYLYYSHLIVTSVFLFIVAVFVCISRVYLKRHYVVDVIVGFLAGILQAFAISKLF